MSARSVVAVLLAVLALVGCARARTGTGGASPAPPAPTTAPATPPAPMNTPTNTPAPTTTGTTTTADPWLLTTAGIGLYRLGARVDSMPAGIITALTPIDSTNCPELYDAEATGRYLGVLLLVVRHNVLVEIASAGGSPGVHSAQGDRVGDAWSTVESRHPTGVWHTNPSGERTFVVPDKDRVMMFGRNPIRPATVGTYAVGLTDHTLATFTSGQHC